MPKIKFVLYALNSFPLHPQLPPPPPPSKAAVTIHHLRRGVGVGGFRGTRGFQGGRGGRDKSSLTKCKGG